MDTPDDFESSEDAEMEAAVNDVMNEVRDRLDSHFLPAEAIVLGLELQPFSLWHWRTLLALRSPALPQEDQLPELEDLYIAARVCSLAPFAALRFDAGWFVRMRLAWLRIRIGDDWLLHEDNFHRYLDHHLKGPALFQGENARTVGSNTALYLAAGLIGMGFTELAAWSCTPGLARHYLAAYREVSGQEISFLSHKAVRDAIESGFTREDILG